MRKAIAFSAFVAAATTFSFAQAEETQEPQTTEETTTETSAGTDSAFVSACGDCPVRK